MPDPHSSWSGFGKEELFGIHRLMIERNARGWNEWQLRLNVFLFLSGLVLVQADERLDDGTVVYFLRRKGWRNRWRGQRWEVTAEEMMVWLRQFTAFLDEPDKLTECPMQTVSVRGRMFRTPHTLLTNLTYEQYNNVQRATMAYASAEQDADNLVKRAREVAESEPMNSFRNFRKEIEDCAGRMREARNEFLSHLLVPARKVVRFSHYGKFLGIPYPVFRRVLVESEYDSRMADGMHDVMSGVSDELFHILQQQVQTALSYYRNFFPHLFSEGGGKGNKNEFVAELDTVNAIMVERGYKSQQDVYETNAVLIFSALSAMIQKAQAIEDANARMRKH